MNAFQNIISHVVHNSNKNGISLDTVITRLELEKHLDSPVLGNPYLPHNLGLRLEKVRPGKNLRWHLCQTEAEVMGPLSEVARESLREIVAKTGWTFSEGCCYCKSSKCVAYTMGESVCGYDYSLD